jgi:hypothetical protein
VQHHLLDLTASNKAKVDECAHVGCGSIATDPSRTKIHQCPLFPESDPISACVYRKFDSGWTRRTDGIWRPGRHSLQRSLRLHLLSSAVRVQSVWRSGTLIKLRQRKTGAYVPIPVADALKDALDAAPRRSPIMLTNSGGKPWSESGFQGAWGKATMRAGIRGLTFHDLRGTAVVTLARAGCNEVEIYSITGHKPGDVQAILTTHYLPRDAEVAGNAIAKLNAYKTARGDQKEDGNLPTALPTALKNVKMKTRKS